MSDLPNHHQWCCLRRLLQSRYERTHASPRPHRVAQAITRVTTFSCTSPTLGAAATAAIPPPGDPLASAPATRPPPEPSACHSLRKSLHCCSHCYTWSCAWWGCSAACLTWTPMRGCSRAQHGKVRGKQMAAVPTLLGMNAGECFRVV